MITSIYGRRSFWIGVVCGIALVFAGRLVINNTTIPDLLIAPLLVADSEAAADAIVVLGAGLIGDCVPNLNAMRRVVKGAQLFRDRRAPMMVITGGTSGGTCPVAAAMAELAGDLGVPADRIVTERESHDTWENGERTAPLLRQRRIERILLVTDRLHMKRAARVFTRLGFVVEPAAVPIYEGHPDNVSMLTAGLRETVALAYYRVRQWRAGEPVRNGGAAPVKGEESAMGGIEMLDAERAAQQTPEGERRALVVLGASYAAGWRLHDLGEVPVINAGVPGERSIDMLARFDRDVVARRPRAVILWGFINDLFRADDMNAAAGPVRESYTEMVRRARAAGVEPILATEVTVRPRKAVLDTVMATAGWLLGRTSYQDQVNTRVVAINGWLRDVAQQEGLLLLDLQRVVGDGDGARRWAYAAADGSHISPVGYAALAEYATPILRRHLGLDSGRAEPHR